MTGIEEKMELFDRLPSELFRPLAAENRHHYWRVLVRLNETYFGPDVLDVAEDGVLHRTLVREVQAYIESSPEWGVDEEATPSIVRASQIVERLVDAGWLRKDHIGVRDFYVMPPVVQKFLEGLITFAEEGPQIIAGKVAVIYSQLQIITATPAESAPMLAEIATQARQLFTTLNATGIRVREVMSQLSANDSTNAYISGFFRDYVTGVFVQDYREMRTENHPLRHRYEIVEMARTLRDDRVARDALVAGYRRLARGANTAEGMFERDIQRLLRFQDIEIFLSRLDANVSRATRQALAYIRYKLRTPSSLEAQVRHAFAAVVSQGDEFFEVAFPAPAGHAFLDVRLRAPPAPPREPEVESLSKAKLSPEQRALSELRHEMAAARRVSPKEIRQFMDRHVPPNRKVRADEIQIETVNDLVVFMAISRAALVSRSQPYQRQRNIPLMSSLRAYNIAGEPGEISLNPYIRVPRFTIARSAQ